MHYRWLSVFSALSAVLLADLATSPTSLWDDIRVKHTWVSVPINWESLGPPPAGTTIDLYIALTPQRENALIDALNEVSDPKHKRYRAHLSKEQVAKLVAPHQDTLEVVHSWLGHYGVPSSSVSTSHGGGWLTISGVPVSQANKLLCASYQLYRHTGTNGTGAILRTVGYSLPAVLHAHVQTVAPTTHFASPRTSLQTTRKRSNEEATAMANATSEELVREPSRHDPTTTPAFLRWRYNIESYVPAAMGRNALGILGFETGFPSQADLTRFLSEFRVEAAAATFTIVDINGGVHDPSHPGKDENIITQYTAAMTYPTPQIFYNTGGPFLWDLNNNRPAPRDAYLGWFNYILNRRNIPPTISISNTIPELGLPPEYARALCTLFAQLGTRGVTVLVPSGDDGVGRGECKDSDGNVRFVPMFPASCPWVTSVGATEGRPETAAGFSGGGFSNYFLLPEYQTSAVHAFLRLLGANYAGSYQIEGRGIPDISAQADSFVYIRSNAVRFVSSTSCSMSVVAAIVSLLNDYLLSNGWAPIGFFNPLLYSYRLEGINDVIYGSNPGCRTVGFPATIGWDPVCPQIFFPLHIYTDELWVSTIGHGCGDTFLCKTAKTFASVGSTAQFNVSPSLQHHITHPATLAVTDDLKNELEKSPHLVNM